MAKLEMSDDEIIAKLDASDRAAGRMTFAFLAAILLLCAAFGIAFITGNASLLQNEGVQIAIAVVAAAGFLLIILRFGRHFRPDAHTSASEPRIVRRRIDAHHRYWRWSLLSGLIAAPAWAWNIGPSLADLSRVDRFLAVMAAGALVCLVFFFSSLLIIGPGWFNQEIHAILNDEFTRELRARTARLGYFTMLAGASATLLTAMWHPKWISSAAVWSLYAGFAIPTLYYIITDWRASPGKEDRDG